MNFNLLSDHYKYTHHLQLPPGTEYMYSYLESRGGMFNETMFFGLQFFLKKLQDNPITKQDIDEMEELCMTIFGFNYFNKQGWKHIVDKHGGNLPLRIRAVPEGLVVPVSNCLVTMENTDPLVPWLVGFVETHLMQTWYPQTVATLSYQIKKLIDEYSQIAGERVSPFHLNDFGYRGVSSEESAMIGGAAHLVNFLGTDTIAGIIGLINNYGAKNTDSIGHSVMATEHSTTTIYTKDGEKQAYEHFLNTAPDEAILSVVADSYNIWNAINLFGGPLKKQILQRKGKLVIRPDSGDPVETTAQCLTMLNNHFPGGLTKNGYSLLDPHVGIIYGDGINYESIKKILSRVISMGFAPSNVVFGMGGGLLQQVNRDTQKFAFKCSAAKVGGQWRDVYKDPITDSGKRSKKGRLKLIKLPDGYHTVSENHPEKDVLETVFENGKITKLYTLDEVRKNANG